MSDIITGHSDSGTADKTGPVTDRVPSPLLGKLAVNLKKERKKQRYSQKRLAEDAGISRLIISNIERRCGDPRLSSMEKIASTLGVPLSALLK